MRRHEYHHCAATTEWIYVNGQIQMTLCGLEAMGEAGWCSLPSRFMERTKGFVVEYSEPVPPKCPDCLAHPDLPLLMLGAV